MTISELSRSRPAAESSNKPRLRATIWNLITRVRLWLGKLVSHNNRDFNVTRA